MNSIYFQLIQNDKYNVLASCLTHEENDSNKYCYYGAEANGTFYISIDLIDDVKCLESMNDYNILKLKRLDGDMLDDGDTNSYVYMIPYSIFLEWSSEQTLEGCEEIKETLNIIKQLIKDIKEELPSFNWHKLTIKE